MEFDIKLNNRKRMKRDSKRMGYFVCFLAFVCFGVIIRQASWYCSVQADLGRIESRIELLKEKKQKLLEERAALDRLDYVEKIARNNYNMVKENELPVFVIEENKKDKDK